MGLEEAIKSIDEKLRIPLPKRYMAHPPGSPNLVVVIQCPSLVIRENLAFYKEWPKMEANIQFLLRWRGIVEDDSKDWLKNYLNIFKAYIHLGVVLDKLEALNFCTPNMEKSNREKNIFEFPPNFQLEKPNDISKIIMVY